MNKTDWIRSARKDQGLKGFQLAQRMQVSAARVSVLEKDEARGVVTLKMMQKAAEAMGCRFEYRIVPQLNLADVTNAESTVIDSAGSKPRYRVV